MRIDFLNVAVSECAAIPAEIFKNLLGIMSRPAAFLMLISYNKLKTVSTLGVCRENVLSVGDKYIVHVLRLNFCNRYYTSQGLCNIGEMLIESFAISSEV